MKPDFRVGTFRPLRHFYPHEESPFYRGFEGVPGPNESGGRIKPGLSAPPPNIVRQRRSGRLATLKGFRGGMS